jgi:hypothetical protein
MRNKKSRIGKVYAPFLNKLFGSDQSISQQSLEAKRKTAEEENAAETTSLYFKPCMRNFRGERQAALVWV